MPRITGKDKKPKIISMRQLREAEEALKPVMAKQQRAAACDHKYTLDIADSNLFNRGFGTPTIQRCQICGHIREDS